MSARHNPEPQSDYSVDQDPDGISTFVEHKKQADLNDSFGNENYAYYEGEKNHTEQRIHQQINCSHTVQPSYEGVPARRAASEMNPEDEMSNRREHKNPS